MSCTYRPSDAGSETLRSSDRRLRTIARRSAILLSGTAAIALSIAQPASAVNLNDPAAAAAGGIAQYWDTTNTQPNVVALFNPAIPPPGGANCTGTLIDSRTILTDAHCIISSGTGVMSATTATTQIRFNPDANTVSSNDRALSGALAHAAYDFRDVKIVPQAFGVNDIALLSLAKPVTNVTPVTLLKPGDPMPAVGTLVVLAGYGFAGTGTVPGDQFPAAGTVDDSRRRVGQTNISAFSTPNPGSVAPVIIDAVFRDPTKFPPGTLPPFEAQPDSGDSGGPLFIMTPNGLVQIGTLIGGVRGYGGTMEWTPVIYYADWIAQNDPLRITSARAGTFSWSQSAAWLDTLGRSEVPNNTDGNFLGFGTLGRYYNVTIAAPTLMSLDMNPQIDSLSIAGAQSQLIIGAPYTLEVLLGTTLSNGTLTMAGGTLATSAFLMSGGLLTGGGTIGGSPNFQGPCGNNVCVTVSGGTVAPVGTLSIQGNYTQTGGLLQFQLAPPAQTASSRLPTQPP
jgi:subtilase-type serine protease